MLLQGQPAEALQAYTATLQHSPRRFNSVAGAMRAAERVGDNAAARRFARELLELGTQADPTRAEIVEARANPSAIAALLWPLLVIVVLLRLRQSPEVGLS